jgi:hypothetical protein
LVATIVPIPTFNFKEVKYYTLKYEERDRSEFDDFFERHISNIAHHSNLDEIKQWIIKIGERGAAKRYFKPEDLAERILVTYESENEESSFGLRLYCLRLSESVVVLINGALKTAKSNRDCPNVWPHFSKAQIVSKKVSEAIGEGRIEINFKQIKFNEDDFYLDI